MLLEIDHDTADKIVAQALRESLECLTQDIARLSTRTDLKTFEQEDLDYNLQMLDHLQEVFNYFTGDYYDNPCERY